MERVNPYLMLTRGDDVRRPPILLLQGTADANVEHERADSFADAYRARGGEIELVKFPGASHAFITRDPGSAAAKHALSSIVRFVTDRISQKETIDG
jgi:dipeptidyl aminopeptidase/acylaminoacyl peptidase